MKGIANHRQPSHLFSQRGITLVEMIVVMGILSLLMGIAFVSVSNIQILSTNTNTTTVLASDLKAQQMKAMTGDTEGRGIKDNYGIKILPHEYIFFHGNAYNAAEASNFSIDIASGFTLSTTFPEETVLFASNSGEVIGFVEAQNTITLTNTQTGQNRTILLNKYGTVTTID